MSSGILSDDTSGSRTESEVDESAANGGPAAAAVVTCYCKKPRNIGAVEIQCAVCLSWYHGQCITSYVGSCIPFLLNYQFCCKTCNPSHQEALNRRHASFNQMCQTVLANLTFQNKPRLTFSMTNEVVPFIDKNWENLTTMPRRNKTSWHATVAKTLSKELEFFYPDNSTPGDLRFGLVCADLSKLSPYYDRIITTEVTGRRGVKRKNQHTDSSNHSSRSKKAEALLASRLSADGYPIDHPYNKDGYRYILAENDIHAPGKQAFDESNETSGKPIPGYFYRKFISSQVLLALHDRAPQLKVSDNRLVVSGEKGYSMVRATHGVIEGGWYFEVTLDDMPGEAAARIGWAQSLG